MDGWMDGWIDALLSFKTSQVLKTEISLCDNPRSLEGGSH